MATIFRLALTFILFTAFVSTNPEQGKLTLLVDQDHPYAAIAKHLYKDSKVTVSVSLTCYGNDPGDLEISWLLRLSPCAMEYVALVEDVNSNENQDAIQRYMNNPITYISMPYSMIELLKNEESYPCSDAEFKLENKPDQNVQVYVVPGLHLVPKNGEENEKNASGEITGPVPAPPNENIAAAGSEVGVKPPDSQVKLAAPSDDQAAHSHEGSRQKREETHLPPAQGSAQSVAQSLNASSIQSPNASSTQSPDANSGITIATPTSSTLKLFALYKPNKVDHQTLAAAWKDGNYLFILKIKPKNANTTFKADVTIRMLYGDDSYISALDYPLLIFYDVMGLIYILYGLVWFLLLAYYWRDLLRVQFWIGAVILLGMLEKAVFFAEYENINKTGESVYGTVIFAELVSCLKRTLARLLVIIVSLGFGIIRPRLGQTVPKLLLVGVLFFTLASVEGCMRASSTKVDQSNQFLLAAVPLAVLDAVICTWIFSSLVQTIRTLRLRRNFVKLALYRHFTNALVFNVLASGAYLIWFATQHKFKDCIKDWKQLWVDEAFWHLLFVVLLFIIMVLWRPSANKQRFASTPLLDNSDEEEEDDSFTNGASEGMKMRGMKNGSTKQRDSKNKEDDDLRWVEEHIPSSVAEKVLPSSLDADEKAVAKYEMSKME